MPYLANFKNDWAMEQIIIQYFMNCRRYEKKYKQSVIVTKDAQGRRVLKSRKVIGKVKPVRACSRF